MEGAFAFFRRWSRYEPAAFFYFGCLSLPAIYYLCRFVSPRMGCVSSRTISPADVHRRTRSAAQWRLGSAVHAPPYIRVGREDGFCGRAASVTSQPLTRQLSFQASQGLGYGATLLYSLASHMRWATIESMAPLTPHGSHEREAAAAVTERSP